MLRLLMLACIVAVVPRRAESGSWYDGPCGISKYKDAGDMPLGSMIVGGKDARIYEFPWQVSLETQNYLFCGGSIINKHWILTAAHCVVGKKREHGKYDFEIVVGEYNLKTTNPYRKSYDVELFEVHPDYNNKTYAHDFALVKVVSDISFDESHNVQPVCPPDQNNEYAYRKAVVSGWGIMNTITKKKPDILQYTTLNITTNDFCSKRYPGRISLDMVCTIDRDNGTKRDSCEGDSGGPLVVKEVNGTFNLVGVVSWGRKECASGYPGVYGRITSVYGWIFKTIEL